MNCVVKRFQLAFKDRTLFISTERFCSLVSNSFVCLEFCEFLSWQLSAENIARERDGLIDAMNFFHFEQGMIITFDQEDKMIVDEKIIDVVPFWKVFGR